MTATVAAPVDAAALLHRMVEIESVSGGEAELAGCLALELADRGFDVQLDAAGNLIAAWGDGARSTALVGHLEDRKSVV